MNAAAIRRVVTDDAGRDRIIDLDRLAVAHHFDFFGGVVRHRHRAAERDPFLRQSSDDRILKVPEVIRNLRIDETRQLDAFLRELGFQLIAVEHHRRKRPLHVHDVELAFLECEQAGLVFLDDADLDAADLRHLLAFHLGN